MLLGLTKVFIMKDEAMLALAKELAKNLKTEADLNDFSRALKNSLLRLFLMPSLLNIYGMKKIALAPTKMHVMAIPRRAY